MLNVHLNISSTVAIDQRVLDAITNRVYGLLDSAGYAQPHITYDFVVQEGLRKATAPVEQVAQPAPTELVYLVVEAVPGTRTVLPATIVDVAAFNNAKMPLALVHPTAESAATYVANIAPKKN